MFSCEFVIKRSTGAGIGLIRSEELGELGDYVCVSSVLTYKWQWLFQWAMVSGALAPIFGIGVLTLMLFECCCKVCCSKVMQGFLFFCALFNQACTFLIYISSPCYVNGLTCKLGYGSLWSIIAFFLYLIACMFLCFSPTHDPACFNTNGEAKQAAKQEHDEEQPAPAAETTAEATVVAAAVVKEENKQPEETKVDVEEKQQMQAVAEKEVAEETSVAAAASCEEVDNEGIEEASVPAAASVKDDEPGGDAVDEVDRDKEIKVSINEDGISARLKESKRDPSLIGNAPDPDALDHGEDPDGDKFVGRSIKSRSIKVKASPSLQTAPW